MQQPHLAHRRADEASPYQCLYEAVQQVTRKTRAMVAERHRLEVAGPDQLAVTSVGIPSSELLSDPNAQLFEQRAQACMRVEHVRADIAKSLNAAGLLRAEVAHHLLMGLGVAFWRGAKCWKCQQGYVAHGLIGRRLVASHTLSEVEQNAVSCAPGLASLFEYDCSSSDVALMPVRIRRISRFALCAWWAVATSALAMSQEKSPIAVLRYGFLRGGDTQTLQLACPRCSALQSATLAQRKIDYWARAKAQPPSKIVMPTRNSRFGIVAALEGRVITIAVGRVQKRKAAGQGSRVPKRQQRGAPNLTASSSESAELMDDRR